jgi:Rad3-related DNA helicase
MDRQRRRMSGPVLNLTTEEYEERKRVLDDLKKLVKAEQEQVFFILKRFHVEFSENSNGVFFDLSRLPKAAFQEIQKFLIFCQANRKEFEERDREMETSRLSLGEVLQRPKAMQTTLSREWQLYSQNSTA